MKLFATIALLAFPIFASAQIYKCTQPDGKIGYSDKPCPKNALQESLEEKSKNTDWLSRLQAEKPASIVILDVLRKEDEVIIKYGFKSAADSNEFLKLANRVSHTPVTLSKYIKPESGALGRAELKVSDKPDLFTKRIKNKNAK